MKPQIKLIVRHREIGTKHTVAAINFTRRVVSVDPQFEIPSKQAPYFDEDGHLNIPLPTYTNHASFDDVRFRIGLRIK